MKSILLLFALILGVATTSHAQMGTMLWQFNSRAEVKEALEQTRGDLRQTYNVLICAGRQGFCNTGIGFYENIVVGHEFDASPQDSAAYAFAFDLGYSFRPWGWKRDEDDSIVKNESRALAQLFRDRARTGLPDSPEVLVMRAFWSSSLEAEDRKQAYEDSLRAVELVPDWADAYYWLGTNAGSYSNIFSTPIAREEVKPNTPEMAQIRAKLVEFGRLQLRAYDKAESLDAGLRPHLYWSRLYAYQNLRDKESVRMIPILVEEHLRAFPNFAGWYYKVMGKTTQQWRQDYYDLAAEIAAENK